MFLFELILAFLIAIALAALLVYPLSVRGPGPIYGLLFFFLILFLAAWAGGLWMRPLGPRAWGVPWLGFVLVGLIVALILAAASPYRRTHAPQPETEEQSIRTTAVALTFFFYIAVLVLLAAIGLEYLF